MLIKNKKGVELNLQAVVIIILTLIVLIVMITFFVKHYGTNATSVVDVGKDAINSASNYK